MNTGDVNDSLKNDIGPCFLSKDSMVSVDLL
jgi:hypothetical protein